MEEENALPLLNLAFISMYIEFLKRVYVRLGYFIRSLLSEIAEQPLRYKYDWILEQLM